MTNDIKFKQEIVEELIRLHNENAMLRTMLLDAGVDIDDEEWEGNYQSEELIYNL